MADETRATGDRDRAGVMTDTVWSLTFCKRDRSQIVALRTPHSLRNLCQSEACNRLKM